MGSIDIALSRDGPSAQKFFATREALIAKEKQHRSGKISPFYKFKLL
jgi:hypothetical protein